jgi:hypothetical protein
MVATTDGGSATPGAMPRRGRPSNVDLLARILRPYCQCGRALGEAACAVCRIPLGRLEKDHRLYFRQAGSEATVPLDSGSPEAEAERAKVRGLGNRAAKATTTIAFRELFGIADRKGLGLAWLAHAAGVSRQTICNWRAGEGMAGNVARRKAHRLLDAVRRAPEPVKVAEPPPPPPPPPPMTPEERFWSHVQKSEGCWEWTGSRSRNGYAVMGWKGKGEYARRISLDLAGVPVPRGKWIVHACRNSACVRPDHLAVVTPKEAVRKYRRAWTPGGKARNLVSR